MAMVEQRKRRYVEIADVFCQTKTAKALRVIAKGKWLWVPRSMVSGNSGVTDAEDFGVLRVAKWWAEENDLWSE